MPVTVVVSEWELRSRRGKLVASRVTYGADGIRTATKDRIAGASKEEIGAKVRQAEGGRRVVWIERISIDPTKCGYQGRWM